MSVGRTVRKINCETIDGVVSDGDGDDDVGTDGGGGGGGVCAKSILISSVLADGDEEIIVSSGTAVTLSDFCSAVDILV
jgi:hypothetical protein